jgi:hypothetical protein
VLAAIGAAGTTRAQAVAPYDPPPVAPYPPPYAPYPPPYAPYPVPYYQAVAPLPVFPVQIDNGEPGSAIQLFVDGRQIACSAGCSLSLRRGSYNLAVTDVDGNQSRQNLNLVMPSRAVVTPANHAVRITGLVLLGAAAAGAMVGLFGMLRADAISSSADCTLNGNCQDPAPWIHASEIGFAAAFAFGITGFMLWHANRTAGVEVTPLAEP